MSFNVTHPECQPDEIFLTNANDELWRNISWRSKRKGKTAFSENGIPLNSLKPRVYPVFVKREEVMMHCCDLLAYLQCQKR